LQHIAIIGSGPTGIYTLHALLQTDVPMAISIFERAEQAGVGMPYRDDCNNRLMLANIASIEIPPLGSRYLDWLRAQPSRLLRKYGVDHQGLHDRQFLPRIHLGQYFRDQFLNMVDEGRARGFAIHVHERQAIVDLEAAEWGVSLWSETGPIATKFDMAVIATGHVWPDGDETPLSFFPSPWSGMLDAEIPPVRIGILGTSLSAIDAAMAVAAQHGHFHEQADESLCFERNSNSEGLSITLMSRTGILPEADFYCPIPYIPLTMASPDHIQHHIQLGSDGLLDRIFDLVKREIALADPTWADRVGLAALTADDVADAYFASRLEHDPFRWAAYNLREVERNKREEITVPWRYAILRLHEAVEEAVPHFTDQDRQRFDAGLSRIFVDNYAAVPSETIRRLLALRAAAMIDVKQLGSDYDMTVTDDGTTITSDDETVHYPIFIDARGQKPLKVKDLPFPKLRAQLLHDGQDHPLVDEHYALLAPDHVRGRIALAAIPFLMHDKPFIQGIAASAEIGKAVAQMAAAHPSTRRRHLVWNAA
jgi:uncharacterized NAD(P)/FAD-binding protein YdhS